MSAKSQPRRSQSMSSQMVDGNAPNARIITSKEEMSATGAKSQRQSGTNQVNLTTCSNQNRRKPFIKQKSKDKENTRRSKK